jgi:hypothetical protein
MVLPNRFISEVVAPSSGQLRLVMNDRIGYYADNSGSITVSVSIP